MPLETQFDQSAVQDPRLAAALAAAGGDEQKARAMMAGEYNDVRIIIGKFLVPGADIFSSFMIFSSIETGAFLNISIIIYGDTASYAFSDVAVSWKKYYRICERIAGSVQLADSSELLAHLRESLIGYDILTDMKNLDADNAGITISDIVEKFYGIKNIECSIRIEQGSTLDLIEEKITIQKQSAVPAADSAPQGDTRPEIEKKAQFVVEAKGIISPLKGKQVHDLKNGDRIILLFTNRDGISIKVAESLGALDDKRNFLPIKGRVVDKVPVEKLGYYIYVSVAKNVLAKITEEGNVQIETDETPFTGTVSAEEQQKTDRNLVLYIALFIGLVALAGLLIYAIL